MATELSPLKQRSILDVVRLLRTGDLADPPIVTPVARPEEPSPALYANIGFWEMIYAYFYWRILNVTKLNMEGSPMAEQQAPQIPLLESAKGFLTGMAARWLFKLLSGALLYIGVSDVATVGISMSGLEALVGAIITFAVGAVISLFQHRKAVVTPPPAAPEQK